MKKISVIITVLVVTFQYGFSQYGQSSIHPEKSGNELLTSLVDDYKATIQFMSYGMTRDTMFRYVYAVNDSLSCVYTGHTLYMDPSKDPTTTVLLGGSDNGINTEHTFPRSKGAEFGNPKSDMHHLFPTRAIANEERSNFPFGEIDDDDTDKWFYKDEILLSKPTSNIDAYSEWRWQRFEPREAHKGNVARAMMYFYTMYKDEADAKDPDFFSGMQSTLCDWHFQDPVDSLEYARTNLIAQWQQYPNPFILDCSLASRTYCDEVNDACQMAVGIEDINMSSDLVEVAYIQESNQMNISFVSDRNYVVSYSIYDMNGRLVTQRDIARFPSGMNSHTVTLSPMNRGIYVYQLNFKNGSDLFQVAKKISVIN